MNRTLLAIGLAVLILVSLSYLSTAAAADRASFDNVTKVAAVTVRDGGGRVQRFKDSGGREFAVTYDAQHRVQTVSNTRGPHVSDIVSVGYDENGRLLGVRFRSGYTLFFDHQANGTIIRDVEGASLLRKGRSVQPGDAGTPAQIEELAAVVNDLESLIASLGQPVR